MPIKPENRKLYPPNWKDISLDIRVNRAKNRCEACGIKNYSIIKRFKNDFRKPSHIEWVMIRDRIRLKQSNMTESLKYFGFIKIVLTVAHLDHNPQNNDYSNLKALCQKCHNSYDRKHRNQTIKKNRLNGQLELNL